MIENIKLLMSKIPHGKKHLGIAAVSEKCKVGFGTIKSTWLCDSGGWSVPNKHLKDTNAALQETVKHLISIGVEINDIDVKEPEKL